VGRAPNLPSQVARLISDEIPAGRFKPGDRLPTERELAETFGVSRNVVREAIAKLRFEGAVEPRQGSGVFVLGNKAHLALRIDTEIWRNTRLFSNLFELRSILEVEAAGLAAARRTRSQLAESG
jgi:DNA-binding FadR family transcriptional regulator